MSDSSYLEDIKLCDLRIQADIFYKSWVENYSIRGIKNVIVADNVYDSNYTLPNL